MKITEMNKKQLVDYLKANEEKVNDKSLLDSVVYAIQKATKNINKVLKADLVDLATAVAEDKAIGALAPIENSTKEETKEEPDIKKVTPKKETKKKPSKKVTTKKEPKKVVTKEAPKQAKDLAENFPETVKIETEDGEVSYKLDFGLKTYNDVIKAIEDGKDLVFAFYWNKRHLKQFKYDTAGIMKKKIKEFPQDLDLAKPFHFTRENTAIYLMSIYTDVIHVVLSDELEVIDGLRFCNGVEFNIYSR